MLLEDRQCRLQAAAGVQPTRSLVDELSRLLLVAVRAGTYAGSMVNCTCLRYIVPYVHQQNALSSSLAAIRVKSQWAV